MIVHLATEQLYDIRKELVRAGDREIGGVMVGQHIADGSFRLVDVSVQRSGGGRLHFKRDPARAARFVNGAIARNGGDPRSVNYLGEWHSHPGCAAVPSIVDVAQMADIVQDPEAVALFSVLMIVRLSEGGLELSMTLFQPTSPPQAVQVELTDSRDVTIVGLVERDDAFDEQTDRGTH